MIELLTQGHFGLFAMLLVAIVLSLTFHEFGHAACAKMLGDDTAERHGRLTLNPLAHIDPMGLLMVVAVGFGYARPVPVNPARLRHAGAAAAVAFAGPFANLVLAALCVNFLVYGLANDIALLDEPAARVFFLYLARINLLLMLFNLIPIGRSTGTTSCSGCCLPDWRRATASSTGAGEAGRCSDSSCSRLPECPCSAPW